MEGKRGTKQETRGTKEESKEGLKRTRETQRGTGTEGEGKNVGRAKRGTNEQK